MSREGSASPPSGRRIDCPPLVMRRVLQLAGLLSLALSAVARADAPSNTVEVGGYYRLQALTDFQGGNGRLGLSTIYGRLLNEGPYGIVELRYNAIGWTAYCRVARCRAADDHHTVDLRRV